MVVRVEGDADQPPAWLQRQIHRVRVGAGGDAVNGAVVVVGVVDVAGGLTIQYGFITALSNLSSRWK